MTVKELRVGNYIKQIKYLPIEWFVPLDLSEEILLKVGFEAGAKSISEGQSFNIDIGADRKLTINNVNGNPHAWIKDFFTQAVIDEVVFISHPKYLHQLQNLYFALTGQELNTAGL